MDRKMKIVLGIAAGVALTGVAVAVYKSLKCLQQARELDECDCGCCHDDDDGDCCENCSPDYLSIEHEEKEDKPCCCCGCEDETNDEATAPEESTEDEKKDDKENEQG